MKLRFLAPLLAVIACGPPPDQEGISSHRLTEAPVSVVASIGMPSAPGELRSLTGMTDGEYYVARGFYAPEDGGGGSFVWDAGCTDPDNVGVVVVPVGFGAGDAGTDAGVTPGCFRRQVNGVPYELRWFGAKGQYRGTNGLPQLHPPDDAPALMAAIAALPHINQFDTAPGYPGSGGTIHISAGEYWMGQTVYVGRSVRIFGDGGGPTAGATRIYWPAGVTGIRLPMEGSYSHFDNLWLIGGGKTAGTPDELGGHGIYASARLFAHNTQVYRFRGDGIFIRAASVESPSTNGSDWLLENVYMIENGQDGLETAAEDASSGMCLLCMAMANGRWGVNEHSFLGNTYIDCHADSNGYLMSGDGHHPATDVYFGGAYKPDIGGTNTS